MVVTKFGDKMNTAWTNKSGQSLVDIYNQERKRLKELDSMDYKERYLDKKAQNRANNRMRRRRRKIRYHRWLEENE